VDYGTWPLLTDVVLYIQMVGPSCRVLFRTAFWLLSMLGQL
jgi:hypothetical protein